MAIEETIKRLERDWATPRSIIRHGKSTMFRFQCSFESGPITGDAGIAVPKTLQAFWNFAKSARLFEDVEYGQWGLVLMSPKTAATRTKDFANVRAKESLPGDLVVGEFLGDQDLLLLRCDPEAEDFGRVLVALPLDSREDWYDVSPDLDAFLLAYERAQGAKFWEVSYCSR